jgi:hypothetical protein
VPTLAAPSADSRLATPAQQLDDDDMPPALLAHLGHWYEPLGFAAPVLVLISWLVVQRLRS